jgi:hypothetical protein
MDSAVSRLALWLASLGASVALVACGGSGESASPPVIGGPQQTTAVTVAGPGGSAITIPPNALHEETPIALRTATAAEAPALPAGFSPVGPIVEITPHYASFSTSARVRVPFDPSSTAAGDDLVVWKASPGGLWRLLEPAVRGSGVLEVDVDSLSYFVVARRPVWLVGPQPPEVRVSYVTPDASNWSVDASAFRRSATTLLRPTDIVLRTEVLNLPACAVGWSVIYEAFQWFEERSPPYAAELGRQPNLVNPYNRYAPNATLPQGAPLITSTGTFLTLLPWAAIESVNNRFDELEIRRTLAATVTNNAVSPNGSTYVGYAPVAAVYDDFGRLDPGLTWLKGLFDDLLGIKRVDRTPPPPPTVTSVYVESSRLLSQLVRISGPRLYCNGVPFQSFPGGYFTTEDRDVFAVTGNRLINISRGPRSTTVPVGWDFLMDVDVFNSGPGINDHRVNVEWFRAAPGSDLFQTFATTTSTQFPGNRHSLQRASTLADNGSRWRAVACRIQDPSLPTDCVESPIATLTVTP